MSEETQTEPTLEKTASPGDILRQAREKYGLSEEDVAAELNLSVYQIRALEEDRFQELPGETYTRGYLKAYARLLNAEEESVLKHFGQQEIANITGIQPVIRETRSGDRHMKLLSVGVIVILAGLMFMWWQGRDESNVVPLRAGESADAGQPAQGMGEHQGMTVVPGEPVDVGQSGFVAAGAGSIDATDSETQPTGTVAQMTEETPPAGDVNSEGGETADAGQPGSSVLSETATAEATGDEDRIEEQAASSPVEEADGEVAEVQETASTPAALVTGSGTDTNKKKKAMQQAQLAAVEPGEEVRLSFSATSWVDLRDADGQRLLYRNVDEGQEVSVRGQPPFSVFLGNAEGVEIEYRGRPFDFSAFTNGIYARFELGVEQTN